MVPAAQHVLLTVSLGFLFSHHICQAAPRLSSVSLHLNSFLDDLFQEGLKEQRTQGKLTPVVSRIGDIYSKMDGSFDTGRSKRSGVAGFDNFDLILKAFKNRGSGGSFSPSLSVQGGTSVLRNLMSRMQNNG